jgi:hypothetical protein
MGKSLLTTTYPRKFFSLVELVNGDEELLMEPAMLDIHLL